MNSHSCFAAGLFIALSCTSLVSGMSAANALDRARLSPSYIINAERASVHYNKSLSGFRYFTEEARDQQLHHSVTTQEELIAEDAHKTDGDIEDESEGTVIQENGSSNFLDIVPIIIPLVSALLLFVAAVGTFLVNQRIIRRSQLNDRWHNIINDCVHTPKFMDIHFTERYFEDPDESMRLSYEAFCYKSWVFVRDVLAWRWMRLRPYRTFLAQILWICHYHGSWLDRNPENFDERHFWDKVSELRATPYMLMRAKPLPSESNDIFWDQIYPDYHYHILGPLMPDMIRHGPDGKSRNPLVDELRVRAANGDFAGKKIADVGCGPGNLILCFEAGTEMESYTGIDRSAKALEYTRERAAERRLPFSGIQEDLTELAEKCGGKLEFDVVIAVNAILPRDREDVVSILEGISSIMKEGGEFLAIMPSFDTIEKHLIPLWKKYYKERRRFDEDHLRRCIDAIERVKKIDYMNLSYADDGVNSQCYHTPESMTKEFSKAGLVIAHLEEVYYPWELTKRFDYGYFPEEQREIWDWYVKAKKVRSG